MGNTTHRRPAADIRAAIAAERRELAAMLDGLSAEEWDAPTLCGGWRVREVAAHMTMGFRYSLSKTAWELIRSRGSLHRMTDRCARKDSAAHSTRELAALLRDHADHPWRPPVGGIEAALGHDVIHGLDITVALGLDRRVPEDRVRILLESVNARTLKFFKADLGGIELRADDLDWSFGTGTPLSGAAQDLLLLAYGRRLPQDTSAANQAVASSLRRCDRVSPRTVTGMPAVQRRQRQAATRSTLRRPGRDRHPGRLRREGPDRSVRSWEGPRPPVDCDGVPLRQRLTASAAKVRIDSEARFWF